ncbi:MAG: zinc-ribbon domain-containing protein [Actinomycetota bacterium]
MTDDDTKQNDEQSSKDEGGRVTDAETAFEEYTGEKKCPECGEPIVDVRSSCPNCGYEYQESDYGDKEAGSEFVVGSAVDEKGDEIPDHETGGAHEEDEDSSDDSSDSSDTSSDDG